MLLQLKVDKKKRKERKGEIDNDWRLFLNV